MLGQQQYAIPDEADDQIDDDYQQDSDTGKGYSDEEIDDQPIDDDDEEDVENLDHQNL